MIDDVELARLCKKLVRENESWAYLGHLGDESCRVGGNVLEFPVAVARRHAGPAMKPLRATPLADA